MDTIQGAEKFGYRSQTYDQERSGLKQAVVIHLREQEFDSNLYHQAQGAPLRIADLPGGSYEDWRKLGFDQHTLINDPLFVDPAKCDYRLKPDSPAWKLGFKPIPFEKMGIRELE